MLLTECDRCQGIITHKGTLEEANQELNNHETHRVVTQRHANGRDRILQRILGGAISSVRRNDMTPRDSHHGRDEDSELEPRQDQRAGKLGGNVLD
jgi:hypothetical protein